MKMSLHRALVELKMLNKRILSSISDKNMLHTKLVQKIQKVLNLKKNSKK
ncbi:hypothetical protein AAAC51_06670 [Priestia megaterium]